MAALVEIVAEDWSMCQVDSWSGNDLEKRSACSKMKVRVELQLQLLRSLAYDLLCGQLEQTCGPQH